MLMAFTERPKLQLIGSALSAQDFAFIERRALEISAQLEGRTGKRTAEVFPDVTPHWHVVTVLPGQERTAADDLSDRCFGVYLPESEHTEIRRGRKVDLKRLMLPGYVFVFVWDVDRHVDRIRACDGVRGLLFINGKVAIVPDALIDRVRRVENYYRPLKGLTPETDGATAKKPKRCWRKKRKVEGWVDAQQQWDNEIVSVHSYSPFLEELRAAANDQQASAFHKALGLALQVPPESA